MANRERHPESSPSRTRDEVSRFKTRSQASEDAMDEQTQELIKPIKKSKAGKRGGIIRDEYKKKKE